MWNNGILIIVLDLPETVKDAWLKAAIVVLLYVTNHIPRVDRNVIPDIFPELDTIKPETDFNSGAAGHRPNKS